MDDVIEKVPQQRGRWIAAAGAAMLLLVAIGLAAGVRSCLRDDPPAGPSAGGAATPPATSPATRPAATGEAGPAAAARESPDDPPPRPVLSLSANGALECRVHQGWPVTLVLVLSHPGRFGGADAPAVTMGSDSRPWSDALRVEVLDGGGKPAAWPLKLARAEPAAGALRLSGDTAGRATWALASADSAGIPAGAYRVRALCAAPAGATVASRPVVIHVSPEPPRLSAEDDARKLRLLAGEAMRRKDWDAAGKHVEALVAGHGDDPVAWELKGDLLRARGRPAEALAAYDAAFEAFRKLARDDHDDPPRTLLAKRRELRAQLRDRE